MTLADPQHPNHSEFWLKLLHVVSLIATAAAPAAAPFVSPALDAKIAKEGEVVADLTAKLEIVGGTK